MLPFQTIINKAFMSANTVLSDREKANKWWNLRNRTAAEVVALHERYSISPKPTDDEILEIWRKETSPITTDDVVVLKPGMRVAHKYIMIPLIIAPDENGPAYTGNEFADNEIALSYAVMEYKNGNLTILDDLPTTVKEGEEGFTKGEWIINNTNGSIVSATTGKDEQWQRPNICQVYGATSEEREANAHLIAAAPDLVYALKECIWAMRQTGFTDQAPSMVIAYKAFRKAKLKFP